MKNFSPLLLSVALLAGCASTSKPTVVNKQTFEGQKALANLEAQGDQTMSAIAIRYPAKFKLADENESSDERLYSQYVSITDEYLNGDGLFGMGGGREKIEEVELGKLMIGSTIAKSRLLAHAMYTNIKKANPDAPVFLQPVVLNIDAPSDAPGAKCFDEKKSESYDDFCLSIEPIDKEMPYPFSSSVIDVAAQNEFNYRYYGLNDRQSLGYDITPFIAVGKKTYDNNYLYHTGTKGSLPEDSELSAFSCLVTKCKTKKKLEFPLLSVEGKTLKKRDVLDRSSYKIEEDGIFTITNDISLYAYNAAKNNNISISMMAKIIRDQNRSGTFDFMPASKNDLSPKKSETFLRGEYQFLDLRTIQLAKAYQDTVYDGMINALAAEDEFASEVRSANKTRKTNKAIAFLGMMASAYVQADAGIADTNLLMPYFNMMEAAEIDNQAKIYETGGDVSEAEILEFEAINLGMESIQAEMNQDYKSLADLRAAMTASFAKN